MIVAGAVTIIGAVVARPIVASYRQKAPAKPVAQAAGASSETITVRLDTYVYEGPDQNHGSRSYMRVGDDEFGYEAFSMVEFDLSSIPDGQASTVPVWRPTRSGAGRPPRPSRPIA
jgi:hypothetical protein